MSRETYLRFVLPSTVDGFGAREGFFTAAYTLRDDPTVDSATRQRLAELLSWFETNLTTPARFNRSSSKGSYRRATAGVSWFKSTAVEHVQKARELASFLAENGQIVEVLRSERVGYIVFEDDVQVVAEPFADTPGR